MDWLRELTIDFDGMELEHFTLENDIEAMVKYKNLIISEGKKSGSRK